MNDTPDWIMPPEWAPQDWLWIGFPHDPQEWPEVLPRAQEQIAAFANAVAESGQEVRLLVRDEANEARAETYQAELDKARAEGRAEGLAEAARGRDDTDVVVERPVVDTDGDGKADT